MVFAEFEAKSKPNISPNRKTDGSFKTTFYTDAAPIDQFQSVSTNFKRTYAFQQKKKLIKTQKISYRKTINLPDIPTNKNKCL